MSAIPPDIAGAAAQAGYASSSTAKARDADRTGQAQLAAQQLEARADKANSVEAEDMDTAVFSDAEGAGGQGRATSDTPRDEADRDAASDAAPDGGDTPILDIEA